MKQIKMTISPVGKPTIEAIGFAGQGCEAATKGLEAALGGGKVEDREFKPEYTQVEETATNTMNW